MSHNLFSSSSSGDNPAGAVDSAPLAARMRPATFDQFVGQEHILAADRVLRRSLESDRLASIILWGPPGSGKTTLAHIIATQTAARFVSMTAVSAGVADLRREVESAEKLRSFNGQKTILFIDEIHRFNKAQQDAILPHVEKGTVTLIGATTENPSFEVNAALLSRCRVFRLEPLTHGQIMDIVRRAIEDPVHGLGERSIQIDDEVLNRLAHLSGGDARTALTALELAVNGSAPGLEGQTVVTSEAVADAMQQPALMYDRAGDMHYHLISAYIKSVRGSSPDAAVYWLARMLEAGEDPLFVARRMMILAAEDIGLADSHALVLATATYQCVHAIGLPEGYLPMTQCTLYLALAPKSNSAITAYGKARADVTEHLNQPVPLHLRNAVTGLNTALGFGKDYKYSHDFDGNWVDQQYLPDGLQHEQYYQPGTEGSEPELSEAYRRRATSE